MAQRSESGPEPDDSERMPAAPRRRSRLGLFLPYVLLLAIVVLWSAGWFWIRGKAASEMDAWLTREAAAGRRWTCAERTIGGFPFRLELRCASLTFARSDGGFSLGPLTVVAQVYQPRHVLLEAAGPFHAEQGDLVGDVAWTSLAGSFHGTSDGFQRASIALDGPKGRIAGADPGPIDFSARHLEIHARPTPGRFESQGAVDVSLRMTQAVLPQLDPFSGNAEPLDASLDAVVEQASILRTRAVETELEAWRQAQGRLDIASLSLVKGDRRLQASGAVGLDEAHRPAGHFDVRAAGLGDLIGQIMGRRLGAERGALLGNLVGGLLGGMPRREANPGEGSGEAALRPLPPLRLAGGRLLLGPIPIPNVTLPALY